MERFKKNTRILDMYIRLCEGKMLNKIEEASKFGVDERSIQRDIDDIRSFLAERATSLGDKRTLEYDRKEKGFLLRGNEDSLMSNSEILAISKILLESRAFTKKEISSILDKLITGCVPRKNMKLVSDLIANEKYHYVELKNKSSIKDRLWALGSDIKENEIIEITYMKQVSSNETVTRIVEPVALLFSEYYFYLHAYIVEKNNDVYEKVYDFPAIFRVDRILDYKEVGVKYKFNYADRFQEGEFRKRIQFMFAGELQRIQFKYTGNSISSILDRLPSAEVFSQKDNTYLITAEVYGKGILMWLLSQGTSVEVVGPPKLREEMRTQLEAMVQLYR